MRHRMVITLSVITTLVFPAVSLGEGTKPKEKASYPTGYFAIQSVVNSLEWIWEEDAAFDDPSYYYIGSCLEYGLRFNRHISVGVRAVWQNASEYNIRVLPIELLVQGFYSISNLNLTIGGVISLNYSLWLHEESATEGWNGRLGYGVAANIKWRVLRGARFSYIAELGYLNMLSEYWYDTIPLGQGTISNAFRGMSIRCGFLIDLGGRINP